MTAVQISIFLENKSGRLAEVANLLLAAGINIRALSLAETVDYGVLRLIVDRPREAKNALTSAGLTVTETAVIAVEMPDRPGALAEIVGVLAEHDLNIEYLYAFLGTRRDNAVVIFRIEQAERAIEVLKQSGARLLTAAEASGI